MTAEAQFATIDAAHLVQDAGLIKLGADLEDVHRQRLEIEGTPAEEADDGRLYDAHRTLRETIDAVPAKTEAGRRVKARAVKMALHFDPDHDREGSGSFLSLSQSLCRDLLA
jgi:hypothetical protein